MAAHEKDASPGRGEGQGAGERIAKALARAGVASRREVERMIAAGRVAVNGQTLTSPAVKVTPADAVTLDGRPVAAAEPTRLFLFHKPPGLVTTHRDPKGRPTVFEALPPGLPRLISVGRLDLNSEGLMLLTNDGELARRLELPSSGFVRRYRARARGVVDEARLGRLAEGLTVDGVRFGPIEAYADEGRPGAANQWVTLSFAEGKNREARRVLEALGLTVNRLIRIAYGPYELGDLPRGEVREAPPPGALAAARAPRRKGLVKPLRSGSAASPGAAPRAPKTSASPRRSSGARPRGPRPGAGPKRRA